MAWASGLLTNTNTPPAPPKLTEKTAGARAASRNFLCVYVHCAPSHQRRPANRTLARLGEGPGDLLQFDGRALLFELFLDGLGLVLGDALFHSTGGAIHQVLGLFQAEAGDFADRLDDLDL